MDGLRTLVMAQKILSDNQVEQFLVQYKEASSKIRNREKAIQAVLSDLESDLEFLGVTGVEDKLQNNVQLTIESLKSAGIQVWMLTGDKVETATSIAISAGLKHRRHQLSFMREIEDGMLVEQSIKDISPKIATTVLIIDGKTLDTILEGRNNLE